MDLGIFDRLVVGGARRARGGFYFQSFENVRAVRLPKVGVPVGSTPCNPAI